MPFRAVAAVGAFMSLGQFGFLYLSMHLGMPLLLLSLLVDGPAAMACSWALLGEDPGPAELAGAVLLVIGVLVTQRPIRRPAAREPGSEARVLTVTSE